MILQYMVTNLLPKRCSEGRWALYRSASRFEVVRTTSTSAASVWRRRRRRPGPRDHSQPRNILESQSDFDTAVCDRRVDTAHHQSRRRGADASRGIAELGAVGASDTGAALNLPNGGTQML